MTQVVIGRDVASLVVVDAEPLVAVLAQSGAMAFAESVATAATAVGSRVIFRELPDREEAKDLTVVGDVVDWMAGEGMTRHGLVVGVGGGALTDTAGFIASVYMRGIRVRYVPTTLLGAVDAAIGGKTGVNVGGKNLVGTFAPAESVFVDLDVLDDLPEALVMEGMAEALKAGLVGDVELFELLESDGSAADLEQVVTRAVAVKQSIVDADFREAGVRAHLNYGHTVGHALERLAGLSHGAAVAVGMVAAGAASEILTGFGDADRVRQAIAGLGLPVSCPSVSRSEVLRLIDVDKKRGREGEVRMVLLEEIGSPMVSPVPTTTLDAALQSIGIGGA